MGFSGGDRKSVMHRYSQWFICSRTWGSKGKLRKSSRWLCKLWAFSMGPVSLQPSAPREAGQLPGIISQNRTNNTRPSDEEPTQLHAQESLSSHTTNWQSYPIQLPLGSRQLPTEDISVKTGEAGRAIWVRRRDAMDMPSRLLIFSCYITILLAIKCCETNL